MLKRSPGMAARSQVPSCRCHTAAFARLNALMTRKMSLGPTGPPALREGSDAGGLTPVPQAPERPVAFTNVALFDGKSDRLIRGKRVVVERNRIKAVEDAGHPAAEGIELLDGGGRTLMPGLIDAHWHTTMAAISKADLLGADIGYINLVAAAEARRTLLRGFTSVRDMAGPSFSLKRAIDLDLTPGPRIWPSGAMISQTSGHGDFRQAHEVPAAGLRPFGRGEAIGLGRIADGQPEVLRAVREQLMRGASQVKLAAGGGVISDFDPIDVSQFTAGELHAAVEAAENWGTYVAVHAYTARAIETAIRAGVQCIEHGQLMAEYTAQLMADQGVWLCIQPFLEDPDNPPPMDPVKMRQVTAGTDAAYGFAKKYGLKTAWGTDILFAPTRTDEQGALLAALARWYAPAEILRMATHDNAALLAMSGPRNPYPGAIGVIEAGAYADLLIVDGDPLQRIQLLADPGRSLKVIMKDGRFYRKELTAPR